MGDETPAGYLGEAGVDTQPVHNIDQSQAVFSKKGMENTIIWTVIHVKSDGDWFSRLGDMCLLFLIH